jgi:hypothetical protein
VGATTGFVASTASVPVVSMFFPVNYIVEATPTFTSVDAATLAEVRGNI